MTNKIQKLENNSLENISGGKLPLGLDCGLNIFGLVTTPVALLGGAACSIASAVYSSKAHNSLRAGDTKNAEKYAKKAKGLTIATAAFSGTAPVCATALCIGGIDGLNYPEVAEAAQKFISKRTNPQQ